MFTGLVDHAGEIVELVLQDHGAVVVITSLFEDLLLGESIAVDGICLTVTAFNKGLVEFELSPETLSLTAASMFEVGTQVNLERALTVSDRLGGHFVTGHVDEHATLKSMNSQGDYVELEFECASSDNQHLLTVKGSVAVNGVSLTVNSLTRSGFTVMLIPHTLEKTNLKHLAVGRKVNIEYDMLAKMVARQVELIDQKKSISEVQA